MRKILVGAVLVAAAFLSAVTPGAAQLPLPDPTDLPTDLPTELPETCLPEPIDAAMLPELVPADLVESCGLIGKLIVDHGVGALVPRPPQEGVGRGVYSEGIQSDGATQELGIEVNPDGTILLRFVGDEAADNLLRDLVEHVEHDLVGRASDGPACRDGSNSLVGYKERDPRSWFFHRRSVPGSMDAAKAQRAITKGAAAIPNTLNDCDISGSLNVRQRYAGTTGKRADLTDDGNCATPDGTNVTDFGPLPVAGRTCAWYAVQDGRDEVMEADVRLGSGQRWTFTPNNKSCSNRLDMQATVTHESGHAFGLGHVSHDHIALTMTEFLPTCTANQRTLGLGDIRGLRALYR